MRDAAEEDPREVEASKHGLNYIGLDGNIACLVNGAGLAMATMDIIKFYGGEPAKLSRRWRRRDGRAGDRSIQILIADKKVKAILVNIFGGIMKCDVIGKVYRCSKISEAVGAARGSFGRNECRARQTTVEAKRPSANRGGRSRRCSAKGRRSGKRQMKVWSAIVFLALAAAVSAEELPRKTKAPRESYPNADVIYDSVTMPDGKRLRSIVTKPRDAKGKLPVIFLAGWLSCDSVEAPADTKMPQV